VAKRCVKSSLPLIPFPNKNQVIRVAQVEFGSYGGALYWFKSRRDEWQRIFILDSDLVQTPVVDSGICLSSERRRIQPRPGKKMV